MDGELHQVISDIPLEFCESTWVGDGGAIGNIIARALLKSFCPFFLLSPPCICLLDRQKESPQWEYTPNSFKCGVKGSSSICRVSLLDGSLLFLLEKVFLIFIPTCPWSPSPLHLNPLHKDSMELTYLLSVHLGVVFWYTACVFVHTVVPSYCTPALLWGRSQHPGVFYNTKKTSVVSEANVIWWTMTYANYLQVKWLAKTSCQRTHSSFFDWLTISHAFVAKECSFSP